MVNDSDATLYLLLCSFPTDAACLYQTFFTASFLCSVVPYFHCPGSMNVTH